MPITIEANSEIIVAPVLGGGGGGGGREKCTNYLQILHNRDFLGYFIPPPPNLSRDWCGSLPSSSSYNVGIYSLTLTTWEGGKRKIQRIAYRLDGWNFGNVSFSLLPLHTSTIVNVQFFPLGC